MQRDRRIQLLRVVAMFMIVACHLAQEYNSDIIAMTAQFFNVGVYVFLLISGFLYGGKEISNFPRWFFKKMIKLLIPVYIFMIFVFALNFWIDGSFSIEKVFAYLFNLQGVLGVVRGAEHLWFLTTIMFCYMLIPLFSVIKKRWSDLYKGIFLLGVLGVAIGASFIHNGYVGQQLFYILIFALGYLFGSKLRKMSINWIAILGMICLMFAVRLIVRKFADETALYNIVVASITHIIISLCLLVAVFKLKMKDKDKRKTLDRLDAMSYYIYIVHYIFMVGPVRLMGVTDNLAINTILTVSASFVAAVALEMITAGVYKIVGLKEVKANKDIRLMGGRND